jgi:DNA-binding MarR family transcriptional regulator
MQDRFVQHYHLDKGTIARAVRKLEDGGYIRRITDPDNRRAVRLFLTEKGEGAIPLLKEINREWEHQVCTDLSKTEIMALHSIMRHVARNSCTILQKNGDPGDDHE